jgi:hypothetical protein
MHAINIHHAIHCFRESSARLMAAGTKVTIPTIKREFRERDKRYWIGILQSPVITRIAGVDLVAGATVLTGGVGVAIFHFGKGVPFSNTLAESPT